MPVVQIKVENLPARVSETQIREVFGQLGRVTSIQLSGNYCLVEMEGTAVREAIDSSGIGEIRLGDMLKIDSSGLGELESARVSLAR